MIQFEQEYFLMAMSKSRSLTQCAAKTIRRKAEVDTQVGGYSHCSL
ncbi:hypothetical protein C5167_026499 [Papaver somniferum]|nr:hypothetical protein C5167_026499 [Papaver somniferum]